MLIDGRDHNRDQNTLPQKTGENGHFEYQPKMCVLCSDYVDPHSKIMSHRQRDKKQI